MRDPSLPYQHGSYNPRYSHRDLIILKKFLLLTQENLSQTSSQEGSDVSLLNNTSFECFFSGTNINIYQSVHLLIIIWIFSFLWYVSFWSHGVSYCIFVYVSLHLYTHTASTLTWITIVTINTFTHRCLEIF